MFYPLIRKLLFQLDAETAHHVTLRLLKVAAQVRLLGPPDPAKSCSVKVMGLDFPNRVGLAAGLDKGAEAIDAFGALGFGFVEVGTLTPRPQAGNPRPRLFRLPEHQAIINRMGFNNPGLEEALACAARRRYTGVLGVNIGKNALTPNENALADYMEGFRRAAPVADYVAVNVSSPNTKGLRDLQTVEHSRSLLQPLLALRDELAAQTGKRTPLAVKIAPDLENAHVQSLGKLFREMGVDGVIATNTTLARGTVTGHPHSQEAGGLSGPPVRARATEVIALLRAATGGALPIIGVGGILSAADAQEKFAAGAALVQLYTGFIYRGPSLVKEILKSAA